jgi:uncharacterized protein (DUF1015 family)
VITNAQLFEYELNKLVQERIERWKENLAFNSYEEIGQFRFVMGQIAAFSELKELIDEAKTLADKHNR